MSKMYKSECYYRRKECMQNLEIPTITEIKNSLGQPFTEVFFEQCPGALRCYLGLEPPLEGPGNTLWQSPSDILLGKVVLKPPITSKCIKALTHEGILEIGRDVEIKKQNEFDMDKQHSLMAQEKYLRREFNEDLERAVKEAQEDEKETRYNETMQLKQEFEIYLSEQLNELEQKLHEEYLIMLEEERFKYDMIWQEKLEEAVEDTVTSLTKKFLEDLSEQERVLTENFTNLMKHQMLDSKVAMEEEQARCRNALKKLLHNLECKNIANMMYVLCMERRNCRKERDEAIAEYEEKILALENLRVQNEKELRKIKKEKEYTERKLKLREEFVLEIIRQYQKFIYFALKATPTQAEFLLSIEKMMMFELTQKLISTDPTGKVKCYPTFINWKSDNTSLASSKTSEKSSLKGDMYHSCLDVNSPPSSSSNLSSSNALPAIFYHDRMYVREDFRNMLSQGKTISQSNILWNKDVENLIQILKRSTANLKEQKSVDITSKRSHESIRSSVHFTKGENDISIGSTEPLQPILYNADHVEESEVIVDKIQYATVDSLGLLCAKDSLTKHRASIAESRRASLQGTIPTDCISINSVNKKKRRSYEKPTVPSMPESKSSLEKDQMYEIKYDGNIRHQSYDSIIMSSRRVSLKSGTTPISKASSTESKLTLARDSLILRKLCMKPVTSIPDRENEETEEKEEEAEKTLRNSRLSLARDSLLFHKISLNIDSPPKGDFEKVTDPPIVEMKDKGFNDETEIIPSKWDRKYMNWSPPDALLEKRHTSAISMHRDSLEIIRSKPLTQSDSGSKLPGNKAKSSILRPLHNRSHESVVKFEPLPKVYETEIYNYNDSPELIYKNRDTTNEFETEKISSKEKIFLNKLDETKVLGDKDEKIHLQANAEFTSNRIHSMLNILKKDSSLIKLFTKCSG